MKIIFSFLNDNLGLVGIGGALIAYLIYLIQKWDKKRNAAKIILQEIRRAEDIISDYKTHGHYAFTKKIVATNSWARNIHYFVNDLDIDELDKISDLYSMGEYLDAIITKVSDFKFDENLKAFENMFKPQQMNIISVQGEITDGEKLTPEQQIFDMPVAIPMAPWKNLLDEITLKYEPIYNSTIAGKLKKITKRKWYNL